MALRPRRVWPFRLAALAGLVAAGCAPAALSPERAVPMRDAPAAYAHPEPDPGCRATARAPLLAHGLDQVIVRVASNAEGKPVLVEFLSPDLSPAAMMDLRRAFEKCIWKPGLSPDGKAEAWTTTVVRLRD